MMKRTSHCLSPILAAALLAACGSGETGGVADSTGTACAPGVAGTISAGAALEPTLASIQDNVFTPSCTISGCHGGAVAADLRLESGASAGNLISIASSQNPSLIRVIPGDPDNSLLIQKLECDSPPVGARMPLGGPYFDQETIDVIRQWIANGAPES